MWLKWFWYSPMIWIHLHKRLMVLKMCFLKRSSSTYSTLYCWPLSVKQQQYIVTTKCNTSCDHGNNKKFNIGCSLVLLCMVHSVQPPLLNCFLLPQRDTNATWHFCSFQLVDEVLCLLEKRSLLESRLREFGAELEEAGVKKQSLSTLLSTASVHAVRSLLQNNGLWTSDVRLSWVHFFKVSVVIFFGKCFKQQSTAQCLTFIGKCRSAKLRNFSCQICPFMCGANRPKIMAGLLVNIFSKLSLNLNFLGFIGVICVMSRKQWPCNLMKKSLKQIWLQMDPISHFKRRLFFQVTCRFTP